VRVTDLRCCVAGRHASARAIQDLSIKCGYGVQIISSHTWVSVLLTSYYYIRERVHSVRWGDEEIDREVRATRHAELYIRKARDASLCVETPVPRATETHYGEACRSFCRKTTHVHVRALHADRECEGLVAHTREHWCALIRGAAQCPRPLLARHKCTECAQRAARQGLRVLVRQARVSITSVDCASAGGAG